MSDAAATTKPLTLPLMANRLRRLAGKVEKIGRGSNPEKTADDKSEIVAELDQLADLLSGGPR